MKYFYKTLLLGHIFFVNYSLAMEKDLSELDSTERVSLEQTESPIPLLLDKCSKAIADRLIEDLLAQRDYTIWLNLEKLPEELQCNILKALCKYHSNIVWQYLSDLISVRRLTDNIGDKSFNYHVKLSSNGRFVSAFGDFEHRKIWDLKANKCLFDDEKITALDFSYDSKYVVIACEKNNIKIWDTIEEQFLPIDFDNPESKIITTTVRLEDEVSKITAITISKDNKLIAAAFMNGIIKLFDMETGLCLNNIQTPDSINNNFNLIKSIFITADQKFLITVSRRIHTNTIRIWNLSTNALAKTTEMHSISCSLSADTKIIFITIGGAFLKGKLIVLDATSGNIQLELEEDNPVQCVCVSQNKKIIIFGFATGKFKILNRKTNECLSGFGHQAGIKSIALSSDNKVVITASLDNTLKLWNTKTGHCINTFEGDSAETLQELGSPFGFNLSGISSVEISPYNDLIAAGLQDGVVKIWKIDIDKGLQAILEEIKKNINHTTLK